METMSRPTILRYSNECSDTNCNAQDLQTIFKKKQFQIKAGVSIVVSTHYIQFSLHYMNTNGTKKGKRKTEKKCQTATTEENYK